MIRYDTSKLILPFVTILKELPLSTHIDRGTQNVNDLKTNKKRGTYTYPPSSN